MTTDEKILALVVTGKFTFPKGIQLVGNWSNSVPGWRYFWIRDNGSPQDREQAHDLCAMHFLRELREREPGYYLNDQWDGLIDAPIGDAQAAIDALWQAVCK
jgi:hypothetical protein